MSAPTSAQNSDGAAAGAQGARCALCDEATVALANRLYGTWVSLLMTLAFDAWRYPAGGPARQRPPE